jgi:hypothetical protein
VLAHYAESFHRTLDILNSPLGIQNGSSGVVFVVADCYAENRREGAGRFWRLSCLQTAAPPKETALG